MITLSGQTLSGGEVQRLAIARLFLKHAPIWILDEPTTALDIYHTDKVMEAIHQTVQTLIVATHDLRLLPHFDRIIVMQDGVILEDGSYQALLNKTNGYLHQMVAINAD